MDSLIEILLLGLIISILGHGIFSRGLLLIYRVYNYLILNVGDLMTLLMKKDILTEYEAKFYIAECVRFWNIWNNNKFTLDFGSWVCAQAKLHPSWFEAR